MKDAGEIRAAVFALVLLLSLLCSSCGPGEGPVKDQSKESVGLRKKAMEGKQTLEDGSVYEGELLGGKPDGYGTMKFPDGDTFEGLHKNGLSHGYGTHSYESSDELDNYVGLWRSGKREGFGILIFSDSSRMEGYWEKDQLQYGEYLGSTGVILSGKWKNSSLAEGKMKTELNEEFTGVFFSDGSFDHGSFLADNGDRYTGRFN